VRDPMVSLATIELWDPKTERWSFGEPLSGRLRALPLAGYVSTSAFRVTFTSRISPTPVVLPSSTLAGIAVDHAHVTSGNVSAGGAGVGAPRITVAAFARGGRATARGSRVVRFGGWTAV